MSIRGRELYIPARLTRSSFAAHVLFTQMVGLLVSIRLARFEVNHSVTDRPIQNVMSGEL
jgi:hypothetical protein